ncbi:response regulator [Kutzneria sp. CA-103260]|uniref:response regulator n=1 Tax=Kutzneria sp. CA-103260 TaxID=2802641 RepID=UPI001BAA4C9D|nr:response regulator [Kutzneria sp. CA-103260]QUQ65562.1 Response regulator receiver domain protein [Kutzneria sp. CA-103260]
MDTQLVVLILGAMVIVGAVVLLWRGQNRRGAGGLEVSLADIFKLKLTLSPQNVDSAREAVREAGRERGRGAVELTSLGQTGVLARVLWVDDEPDNNVYETLALVELGKFVTTATSTEAAHEYLSQLDFAAIITDLNRDGDRDAGLNFIREVRASGSRTPIVVYTGDVSTVSAAVGEAGADAIVDLPNDLVDEIVRRTA